MNTKTKNIPALTPENFNPTKNIEPISGSQHDENRDELGYAQQIGWLNMLRANHKLSDEEYSEAKRIIAAKFHHASI